MHRLATLCLAAGLLAAVIPALAADVPPPAAAAAAAASAAPLASLDIAFVESDLRQPGLAVPAGGDPDFVDWKLPEFGRLLQERAPLVLAANGLTGTGLRVPAPQAEAPLDVNAIAPGRPLLLLRVATLRKWSPRLFSKAGQVGFDVQLLDRAAGSGDKPLWELNLGGSQLGFDPVLGALKTDRVDAAWVDGVLTSALDQLAQQGLVRLSGPKAVKPQD